MSHDAGAAQSIRAQAKQGKQQQKQRKQGEGGTAVDRATADKTVVKAVLANPLTVPWCVIMSAIFTVVVYILREQAKYTSASASYDPGQPPVLHSRRDSRVPHWSREVSCA